MAEVRYPPHELRKWRFLNGFVFIGNSAYRITELTHIDVNDKKLNIYFKDDVFDQINYDWESQAKQAQMLLTSDIYLEREQFFPVKH